VISITDLPAVNATLNATSAVLLLNGYRLIRKKRITSHKRSMIAACCASVLFLISYLTYHYFHGSTPFAGQGWVRPVYFSILISHTILAAAIVPMALITLTRALKERFDAHGRIARWTLPLWLYVSITGVVIYFMLYHW
jgi:uncharacterized membrane protein YozB (DUF420 family)